VIAKSQLPKFHPVFSRIYIGWGEEFELKTQFEQACKWSFLFFAFVFVFVFEILPVRTDMLALVICWPE